MQSPLYCLQTDKTRRLKKHRKSNFKNKITKGIHHILKNSCENDLLQFKSPTNLLIFCVICQALATGIEEIKYCMDRPSSIRAQRQK